MYKEIAESFGSISRRTDAIFRKKCKDPFVSRGLQNYLVIIYENEGIIADEITRILAVDKGTTARAIAKLEKEKYIYRVQDDMDKRKYKLYTTEKAKKISQGLIDLFYNIAKEGIEVLDEKETEELLRLLTKVRTQIRELSIKVVEG